MIFARVAQINYFLWRQAVQKPLWSFIGTSGYIKSDIFEPGDFDLKYLVI